MTCDLSRDGATTRRQSSQLTDRVQNLLPSRVVTIHRPAHHLSSLPTEPRPHRVNTAAATSNLLPKATVSLRRHSPMAHHPRTPTAHRLRVPTALRRPGRLPASNIRATRLPSSLRTVRRPSNHTALHRPRVPTRQPHPTASSPHMVNRRPSSIPPTRLPSSTSRPPLRLLAMAPRKSSSGTPMPTPTRLGRP